ncbi:MAG TPA: SHOCT domain-containing protein [Streptosporangiaceae bacterium]|nr:SHOCT domain-containing protein [Streptosporangiaceae bacterium]
MPGGGPGIPGWFIALFVIVALAGIGTSIWRYSVLRSGGLNPFVAKEQLEARLNQTLTTPPAPPSPRAQGKSIEQRLAELGELHARGVITDEELAAGRAAIIARE